LYEIEKNAEGTAEENMRVMIRIANFGQPGTQPAEEQAAALIVGLAELYAAGKVNRDTIYPARDLELQKLKISIQVREPV